MIYFPFVKIALSVTNKDPTFQSHECLINSILPYKNAKPTSQPTTIIANISDATDPLTPTVLLPPALCPLAMPMNFSSQTCNLHKLFEAKCEYQETVVAVEDSHKAAMEAATSIPFQSDSPVTAFDVTVVAWIEDMDKRKTRLKPKTLLHLHGGW